MRIKEDKTEQKYFAIDFEYIDNATWMGPSENEETAKEYLLNHLNEYKIRGIVLLGVKEIPNPDENNIQVSRKRTLN